MSINDFQMPTPQEWNEMVEKTGLNRALALSSHFGGFVEISGRFIRLGRDKISGRENTHVLLQDCYYQDEDGGRYNIGHMWLNQAASWININGYYYNPYWFQCRTDDLVRVCGMVNTYYDHKNKTNKYTLINTCVLSINGITA